MKLWLVRHAQPLIGPGICYGATDVPADAAATHQTAQVLALALPPRIRVRSSPLQRCEQLTLNLRELRPDLTCEIDARLQEMDFGYWEGQRWSDIAPRELAQWTDNFGTWRCGGKESVHEFMTRVAELWDETCTAGDETAWVTHAGVIRAATLLSQGVREVTRADQWPSGEVAFGQTTIVPMRLFSATGP